MSIKFFEKFLKFRKTLLFVLCIARCLLFGIYNNRLQRGISPWPTDFTFQSNSLRSFQGFLRWIDVILTCKPIKIVEGVKPFIEKRGFYISASFKCFCGWAICYLLRYQASSTCIRNIKLFCLYKRSSIQPRFTVEMLQNCLRFKLLPVLFTNF